MKQVYIQRESQNIFESLEDLLKFCRLNSKYLGFIPEGVKNKYMVVISGSAVGLAVNETGTWTTEEKQKTEKGQYFLFDTQKELYDFLLR